MEFMHVYYLLLIFPTIFLFFYKKGKAFIDFSNVSLLKTEISWKNKLYKLGKVLVFLGSCLIIIALARPRILHQEIPIHDKGISIGILLDVSGSMESVDFEPNRLEVAKSTIENFIKERISDEIALIPFAGNAYTRIPMTMDHELLLESLEDLDTSSVREDGTAIGMAESVGINRIKKSDTQTKVLILVTDGDNNAGAIDPMTAAGLAQEMGIKIYTIGVGTDETIIPFDYFGSTQYKKVQGGLNEELLKSIADKTGGNYYRAKSEKALSDIFDDIDQLEKSKVERDVFKEYQELAYPFILVGLLLVCTGSILDRYVFIQIP